MRKALPIALGLLLTAAACGGGGTTEATGVRGEAAVTTTEATTTTTELLPTTTLQATVAAVPDVAELALEWNEPVETDPNTGKIDVLAFNRFLIEKKAVDVTAEQAISIFLGLTPDDPNVQMLVSEAGGPEATRVTVVELTEDDSIRAVRYSFVVQRQDLAALQKAQTITGQAEAGFSGDAAQAAGGDTQSEATKQGVQEEENTQAAAVELVPFVVSGYETSQCQTGRGHWDFIVAPCV